MSDQSELAIVMDALPAIGGAEKVLITALELFPHAPIYTLLYNREAFCGTPVENHPVVSSPIQRLPLAPTHYRKYLPLMPWAVEQWDLSQYRTILSFSYAVANGVRCQPGQKHLSYTFTPMRYAWRHMRLDGTVRPGLNPLELALQRFRRWDVASAAGIQRFAAVSGWIGEWVRRVYQRDARVIYPPVPVEHFSPAAQRGDYYLTIARLVPHKRIDLIVEAFNQLKLPLVILGDGPEYRKLAARAGTNIRFEGYQPDIAVQAWLSRAKAYLCAGEEDFGIAMVEAQAAGCPVIAYGRGGALEIVCDELTGLFFGEQSVNSLVAAVHQFERNPLRFYPNECVANSRRFTKARFLAEMAEFAGIQAG